MGFFNLKVKCAICNKEVVWNHYEIADEKSICKDCLKNCGKLTTPLKKLTVMDINKAIRANKSINKLLKSFNATKRVGSFLEIDSKQKKWVVYDVFMVRKANPKIYKYTDIVEFELLENGYPIAKDELGTDTTYETFTETLGAAFDGIIGDKKNKTTCNNLRIKIKVNDEENPVVYINLIRSATKKDSQIYKNMCESAKECLSILESISNKKMVKKQNTENKISDADEIRKFNNLLNEGIISQEEFDAKKKQMLGM